MRHFKTTPTAAFIFFRSYSRWSQNARESWDDMVARCVLGLADLGELTTEESELLYDEFENCTALPSGRYMWCGGIDWSRKQANFEGSYNCAGHVVDDISVFGRIMDLSMKGSGCGAVLELDAIAKLPPIKTKLNIELVGEIGTTPIDDREDDTLVRIDIATRSVDVIVGDSRRGWVESYLGLIQLAASDVPDGELTVRVDLSSIRPSGERLQGFGGVANPAMLPELYGKVAAILNGANGRQLTSVECCLLICEAAIVVVCGNIRRSALIFQFGADDTLARGIKDNLWAQNADGSWYMPNPALDALRMGNHTTIFHQKPTLDECIASVSKQYYSGEGAIQWAGEAVARANADLLNTPDKKAVFLGLYPNRELARDWLDKLGFGTEDDFTLDHRMYRYNLNPCGEIFSKDFVCNLSEVHLNTIDPFDLDAQVSAFKAASLSVVALLHHQFEIPRYQRSRELDPIVGVSFTGLFDFFVHLFGVKWLEWWQAGRPANWGKPRDITKNCRWYPLLECDFIRQHHFDSTSDLFLAIEEEYLESWKAIVFDTVTEYCERHGLKVPNRATTCQPAGSKSLLTGASPGWHAPKASRYIRRMTFGKGEPIALTAIDMGYKVIPSQSDKDEYGNLLHDIHDPRVTEWLVEIPCATSWADMPGVDEIEIGNFSALAQFDFYMQVQRHYSTHTTSATIELREDEIEPLATAIYEDIQKDGGYMSAALLARFDSLETFPRLPFEPIDKDRYQQELVNIRMRRVIDNFDEALAAHDHGQTAESGPSGCDSDKCLLSLPEPK
jgi:ribonucleotide reductase class II